MQRQECWNFPKSPESIQWLHLIIHSQFGINWVSKIIDAIFIQSIKDIKLCENTVNLNQLQLCVFHSYETYANKQIELVNILGQFELIDCLVNLVHDSFKLKIHQHTKKCSRHELMRCKKRQRMRSQIDKWYMKCFIYWSSFFM